MKFFLPLLLAIAVCSAGVIEDPNAGYKEGDRFLYFPGDGDGIYHLVDLEEPIDYAFLNQYTRNPNNNLYKLYTRNNPTEAQILVSGEPETITSSNFDGSKETVFLAHGWNGDGRNTMNKLLTEAFLENDDVNVIVLDWQNLANRGYTTARRGVTDVGRGLGKFALWLEFYGLSLEKTHLVGFSLGGHLVGNAGKETNGRIKRITGLDPAGPLYSNRDTDRIRSTDGQYVEIIHTDTSLLGYSNLCGDADFYPNGGSGMPGCMLNSCSHGRAFEYMASSVKTNHLLANECDSQREAERNRCRGSLNLMGNSDINKNRAGIFRINTDRRWPF